MSDAPDTEALVKLADSWAYAFSDGSNRNMTLDEIAAVSGDDLAGDLQKIAEGVRRLQSEVERLRLDNMRLNGEWSAEKKETFTLRAQLKTAVDWLQTIEGLRYHYSDPRELAAEALAAIREKENADIPS